MSDFHKLNITSDILDKLGFSEYWDDNGTSGTRTLTLKNGENELIFQIIEQCQMDDDTEGYGANGHYVSHHYYCSRYASPILYSQVVDLFFLHEMYEFIEKEFTEYVADFVNKCASVKMGYYLVEYLKFRNL